MACRRALADSVELARLNPVMWTILSLYFPSEHLVLSVCVELDILLVTLCFVQVYRHRNTYVTDKIVRSVSLSSSSCLMVLCVWIGRLEIMLD